MQDMVHIFKEFKPKTHMVESQCGITIPEMFVSTRADDPREERVMITSARKAAGEKGQCQVCKWKVRKERK